MKMTSQTTKVVLSLDAEEVSSLKEGVNFKKSPEDAKYYIIYKSTEGLRACKNQCKHQGGLFIKDIEDLDSRTVKCTKHNWKLNVSTMKYVNPPDSFLQDELKVEILDDGGLQLVELNPVEPWLADPREPLELKEGEVKVMYLTHACMELQLGQRRFMFDPWLKGSAFARGWWLLHEPPADSLDRLCAADLIYISHMHSDHLSYPTLKVLSERRPDVPIYVGDTSRPVFWYLEQSQVKLTNISIVPFGVWQNIDEHLRFMILLDGIHPEMDTCIIVEYKGHKILNTVDCTRPNGGRLPENVDLMMSDFAGGASGFPMTFYGGKYTDSWKEEFIKNERKKLLNYKALLVKTLQPRIYCPFAGYFVEAHPSDRYIKNTNIKNTAENLNALIKKDAPDIKTWTPKPGAVLDLALALRDSMNSEAIINPPASAKIYKDSWDFDLYVDELNSAISSEIFKHQTWIQFYYTWAGFQNYNLVVRMIESDDNFEPLANGYDYLVDFLDLSFPTTRPDREHSYIEIKNRIGVMRYVVLHGCLWDDLYIGFQNRISRDPDIYHHKFWNHFQTELPLRRPDWDQFLQQTWDGGLAVTARAWAKHCVFEHNIHLKEARRMHPVFPSVGENIWTAYPPSSFSVMRAMESWINETKYYNYQINTCSKVCGHYTQIVWASSYKVGCAVQLCPNGVDHLTSREGVIFVCNYAPAGNVVTEHPYKSQGEPCYGCISTCEEKLCRSPERDALKSYNWTPDWDLTSSRPKYVTILIVRPVALFFTFLTAYAVHYKYPDSFCYE